MLKVTFPDSVSDEKLKFAVIVHAAAANGFSANTVSAIHTNARADIENRGKR